MWALNKVHRLKNITQREARIMSVQLEIRDEIIASMKIPLPEVKKELTKEPLAKVPKMSPRATRGVL